MTINDRKYTGMLTWLSVWSQKVDYNRLSGPQSGAAFIYRSHWRKLQLFKSLIHKTNIAAMELSSVILTTGSSVGFFRLVNAGVNKLPMPESACRNAWKWRNISTSFVHSFITAIWAVLWWVKQNKKHFTHLSLDLIGNWLGAGFCLYLRLI